MCGFIGTVSGTARASTQAPLGELKKILHHRGPDNTSCMADGRLCLIHNRLSIIDLSDKANQPMLNASTGNVIVFNGEIYNFRELKAIYENISWETNSDTEVLLKLYEHLGQAFIEKLNGIFAFAIYDKKRNKILLCRDRFGVKPLYFSVINDRFVFASEIKAILRLHPKDINVGAVYDYLEYGRLTHNNETFYDGIYALEPAHFLEYDLASGRVVKRRYWDVSFNNDDVSSDEKEVFERICELLRDSMRLNMVSDVEVAISLSSGTDSTLILKLAQERTEKLKAFSFGFEEKGYDEVSRIRRQGSLDSVELYPIYLKSSQMLSKLREAVYYFETPLGGVGTLSAYNMMAEVRRQGIKVMLAGEGADEVFGGYKYYYPAFFKDIEADRDLLSTELRAYSSRHGCLIEPFSDAYRKITAPANHNSVLAPDGTAAEVSHTSKWLKNFVESNPQVCSKKFASHLKQRMYEDLTVRKLPKLLHFQDRASMAHSVETRVPFLDHRLVNFVYSLPDTFKIRNGQSKYLTHKMLKDVYRYIDNKKTKHYVATPQREWLKSRSMRDEILETVKSGKLVDMDLIDYGRFEKDYCGYSNCPKLGNSFFVWKIINIEYLLEQKWT